MLDSALAEAGINRQDAYVTNVVKHFKWVARGERRIHKTPGAREIEACLPWLENEIALIEPAVLVAMGATAARVLLGNDFRVSRQHGKFIESSLAPLVTATIHPSAVLRQQTDQDRRREMRSLVQDFRKVGRALDGRR
ncbi:MAG: uracil-DNA glycosylase family protein [Longimicrobiales bacterium]